MKSAIPRPRAGVIGGIPRCRSIEWDHPPLQPLSVEPMGARALLIHGMTWYGPGFFGCQWSCGPTRVGLGHVRSRVFGIQSLSFSFSSVDRSVDNCRTYYDSPVVLNSISKWWNVAKFFPPTRSASKPGRKPSPARARGMSNRAPYADATAVRRRPHPSPSGGHDRVSLRGVAAGQRMHRRCFPRLNLRCHRIGVARFPPSTAFSAAASWNCFRVALSSGREKSAPVTMAPVSSSTFAIGMDRVGARDNVALMPVRAIGSFRTTVRPDHLAVSP